MNTPPNPIASTTQNLRKRAQALLGTKDAQSNTSKDASLAMRVLFDLASSPTTAQDALALLHELQVHQVELDLQNEELQNTRTELEMAWLRQAQWLDASPSAQLMLDSSGRLMECNARALQCLRLDLAQALGKRLVNWLDAADHLEVQSWLAHAQETSEPISFDFWLCLPDTPKQVVHASACRNPLAPGVLVSWVKATERSSLSVYQRTD
jgi:PAS domain-containing protein